MASIDTAPVAPSVWRQRNFLLVWVGQAVVMQMGGLAAIALTWWLKEQSQSVAAVTWNSLAMLLPRILLGPLAGAVVDRTDRRRLLMATDLVRAVITGLLAWAIWTGQLPLPGVLFYSALVGICATFHQPALQSAIPRLVPPTLLNQANSLNQFAVSVADLVAPIAGGVLVAAVGAQLGFGLQSAAYLLAAMLLLPVRIPSGEVTGGIPGRGWRGLLADAASGLRYLWTGQPMLFFMLCSFALVNFALAPFGPVLPFLAEQRLGLDARGYATLTVMLTVGTLAGAALVGALGNRLRRGLGLIWGITAMGVGVVTLSLSRHFLVAAAGMVLQGMALSLAQTSSNGIFQTRVPEQLQGRVFAVRMSMGGLAAPLSLLLVGSISAWVPPHLILLGAGLLTVAGGLAGYLVRGLPQAE